LSTSRFAQNALLAMQKLQARVNELEAGLREPIAILSAGCRLPGGVRDAADFWRLLISGRDAIRPVPPSRWSVQDFYDPELGKPGKTVSRSGGFLEEAEEFDAEFFGISRREACAMDPQQRLLLETSWEAIEGACISARDLAGPGTGVFIGVAAGDYANLQIATRSLNGIDSYTAASTSASVAAGRLSYFLGLQGPCAAIDTACSSSLAAIHLAVQSLRLGDCDAALAGGVNLALSPFSTVALSQMRMLSPNDRCRPFDAAADGFVRGEGCVVFVLKRLSTALAAHDPILGVIRGAAMNHDGRSGGLTAPNGPAQEAVMRRTLRDANCTAAEVNWVETHGTGTQLGDPIEAQALGGVYGEGHNFENPLWMSALKSNIGHLEAAAGAAATLKAVLALQHGTIPASLHFEKPNPLIAWDRLPVRVAAEPISLPAHAVNRVGVSGFGFSGTNVHLILENAPKRELLPEETRDHYSLPLSAKTEKALRSLAAQTAGILEHSPALLPSICRTAVHGRNQMAYRAVFGGSTAAAVASALRLYRPEQSNGNGSSVSRSGLRTPLPPYPFSRHRHWFLADGSIEMRIDPRRMPFLAEHQIEGAITVPGAVMIDLVLQAAHRWRGAEAACLRDISFGHQLRLVQDEIRTIQIGFRSEGPDTAAWELSSVLLGRTELHTAGSVQWNVTPPAITEPVVNDALQIDGDTFYREHLGLRLTAEHGVMGETFQWMRQVRISAGWLSADIKSVERVCETCTPRITPSVLAIDAAFQLVAGAKSHPELVLPFTIDEVWPLHVQAVPTSVAIRRGDAATSPEGVLRDASGAAVVLVRGITLHPLRAKNKPVDLLYRQEWVDAAPIIRGDQGTARPFFLCGDPASVGAIKEAWSGRVRLSREMTPTAGVVFVAPTKTADPSDYTISFAQFLKSLADAGTECDLWVVSWEKDRDPAAAMLWAVTRVAALEHPELSPRLVDLDPADPQRFEFLLAEIESAASEEAEIAYHGGRRMKPALVQDSRASDDFRANEEGIYWITGGFGALGAATAGWLAERGARHIVLSGRQGGNIPAGLAALGVNVLCLRGDISQPEEAEHQLSKIDRWGRPLAGVIHTAGVLEDALLIQSTEPQMKRVFAPKIQGARNLMSLLRGRPLDFLVFYSSLSVYTSPPGQAAYTAANSYLDVAAANRNATGLRTLSVNFGPWQGAGMASASAEAERMMTLAGIDRLTADQALSALGAALCTKLPQVTVAAIDQKRVRNHPRLSALLGLKRTNKQISAPVNGDIGATILQRIADVLGVTKDSLEPHRSLPELGIDSLIALELKQRVEIGLSRKLPLQDYLKDVPVSDLIQRLSNAPSRAGDAGADIFTPLCQPAEPPQLFLFPGAVGSVSYLQATAEAIGDGHQVTGVDILLQTTATTTLEQLAAASWEGIRRKQKTGPYRLVGHSFGGFLALEVAQQIRDAGQTVSFVGLIDTALLRSNRPAIDENNGDELRYVARVLRFIYLPAAQAPLSEEPADVELAQVMGSLQQAKLMPAGFDGQAIVQCAREAFRAMRAHVPKRYEGSVTLFRASDPFPAEFFGSGVLDAEWDDQQLGWGRYLPKLQVIPVPGNHLTMARSPLARDLGLAIREALRRQLR
jgi:3-oxoacyl-(acyl-carrier-protein) synthase/thioesterase domain-containing protein/NAD(P)-dependent dehydrogenase (short-subunit alcohol dehydrogenase family)